MPYNPEGLYATGQAHGREEMIDAAIRRVLEQRCERGTPWDLAVLECAESLRRLKRGERSDHETLDTFLR